MAADDSRRFLDGPDFTQNNDETPQSISQRCLKIRIKIMTLTLKDISWRTPPPFFIFNIFCYFCEGVMH